MVTRRLLGFTVVVLLCALCACGGSGNTAASTAPTITGLEPASGGVAGGTDLVIKGTGLANTTAGENEVLVGGNPADQVVVLDDQTITCRTPAGVAGPADVSVTKNHGTGVLAGGFTYYPAPTIASVTPDEGTRFGGTEVTVAGTGFLDNNPVETKVFIGLKELTNVVVVDDQTLTGLTPTSYLEVAKDVKVTNNNGSSTLVQGFTYVGPPPVIHSIDPDRGFASAFTPVTIHGEWFTVAGLPIVVTFGDLQAGNVQRVDDYTLTCIAPPGPPGEWVTVTTSNANGATSLIGDPIAQTGFYYIPPPTLAAVTPNSGSVDGGTSVTITGLGFADAGTNTVTFDGNAATNIVVVDDNTLTCDTPGGNTLGPVNVVVTNIAGTGTLVNGFTYTPPAFWWENTFGTPSSTTGDDPYMSVPLQYGFPFFGTSWTSLYAQANGHLDFGSSANYSYSVAPNLLSIPHISHMGMDCYINTSNNMWYTNHVPGRTIITYNGVPEYYSVGANYVQIHLHQSGVFCILYKSITFKNSGGYSPYARVAVNPGGGSSVSVDWTTGVTGGGSTDALNEIFSSLSDLDGGYLLIYPNSGGGYDAQYINSIPTDPDP